MSQPFFASAGSVHWMTPAVILDPARQVFGGTIDLDPCANSNPQNHYATENWTLPGHDCLKDAWTAPRPLDHGDITDVFINPPFGTSYLKGETCISAAEMKKLKDAVKAGEFDRSVLEGWRFQQTDHFAQKMLEEARIGRANTIWISKAAMETNAIQRLLVGADAMCIPSKRIGYINPETGKKMSGVTFPSILFYAGQDPRAFVEAYAAVGHCRYGLRWQQDERRAA